MTHKIYKLFGIKIWEVVGLGSEAIHEQYKQDAGDFSDSTSTAKASGEVLVWTKKEQENSAQNNRL